MLTDVNCLNPYATFKYAFNASAHAKQNFFIHFLRLKTKHLISKFEA